MTDKAPEVFISYSHDSPAHKAWVTELASKLFENGISVTLDRWELRPGGDLAKFMERAVTEADRVLMICTETYVRKANDGRGGVGFEAMIVTAELFRDLGSVKFIPVVRQTTSPIVLPTFLGTRFYINFSNDDGFDEAFEDLLRELHKEPAIKKPPLGKNPFARTPSGQEISRVTDPTNESDKIAQSMEATEVYSKASIVAKHGDLIEWRRLIKRARAFVVPGLEEWRTKYVSQAVSGEDVTKVCQEGLSAYSPLFAITLAGVESGRNEFNNQTSILDEILRPKNWQFPGSAVISNFPELALFTYQALHGATCLETNQLSLALALAKTPIEKPNRNRSKPLLESSELIGWPDSLEHTCTTAWDFLTTLPKNLTWLNAIFGDSDDFHVALCAYYMSLNILELALGLKSGQVFPLSHPADLMVPLGFGSLPSDLQRRAFRLLIRNPEKVREIWRNEGVSDAKMVSSWSDWVKVSRGWIQGVYHRRGVDLPHEELFQHVKPLTS